MTDSISALYCKNHRYGPMDVWYDCIECSEEADNWAISKGYSQAVSPYNKTIKNSDEGRWVNTVTAMGRYQKISIPRHPITN